MSNDVEDPVQGPVDHLAGRFGFLYELMAGLSDEELTEQIAYLRLQRSTTSDGRAAYQYANQLTYALHEQARRQEKD